MSVLKVIRTARRRLMWNAIATHLATTISITLGGLVLLLLLGTQLMNWQWLVLVPITATLVSVYRVRRLVPDAYATAQVVDRRLNLADTLSSAIFFSGAASAEACAQWPRHLLHSHANAIAGSLRLADAVPYEFPRAAYVAVLLAFVSGGMTALRYGYQQALDLRPSLAQVLNLAFGPLSTQTAERRREERTAENHMRHDRSGKDSRTAKEDSSEFRDDGNLTVNHDENRQSSTKANQQGQDQDPQNASTGQDENGNEAENETAASGQNRPEGRQAGQSKSASDRTRSKPAPGSATKSDAGMIVSLQEAMGSLLSRVGRQLSSAFGRPQTTAGSNGPNGLSQHGMGKASRSDRSKQPDRDGSSSIPGESADAEAGQTGAMTNVRHNTEQQSISHLGQGIGSKDGSKDVELAEQLAAMGKIGQIIGRRSEDVAGEFTIEVPSGIARVTTPYLNLNAQHTNVSGDVYRDSVSLPDQVFVQRYFEEIRRQPITGISKGSHAKRSKAK